MIEVVFAGTAARKPKAVPVIRNTEIESIDFVKKS
jgi:hypothetical protein